MSYLGHSTSREEENGKQRERQARWMYGMSASCKQRNEDAQRRKRFVRPCAVHEGANGWYSYYWLHTESLKGRLIEREEVGKEIRAFRHYHLSSWELGPLSPSFTSTTTT